MDHPIKLTKCLDAIFTHTHTHTHTQAHTHTHIHTGTHPINKQDRLKYTKVDDIKIISKNLHKRPKKIFRFHFVV